MGAAIGIKWKFHVLYNPTGAGMIERDNGLLKSGVKLGSNSLWGWSVCLWTVPQRLSRNQKGALIPVDMQTHIAGFPVQLGVQTKEEILKPGYLNFICPRRATSCCQPALH